MDHKNRAAWKQSHNNNNTRRIMCVTETIHKNDGV